MSKRDLFFVGDSHIKGVERDLIVHHLSEKNISLKYKFLMVQMLEVYNTIYYLPCTKTKSIDSMTIHGITQNKLHNTRPHDLAKKIIDISNVCK